MNLTETDIQLLRYLHAVKVATYKQIHRDIYPTYHPRSVCNRLAKLEKMGLITGSQNRHNSCGDKVMSVSKKGFQQFVANEAELRCELKSEAVNHDLQLVDVRHAFLKLEAVSNYLTENQIQTWGLSDLNGVSSNAAKLNSDAVVNLDLSGAQILAAIEYEDSEKAAQRYDPIVKKYYRCEDIGAVFYICKTTNLIRKISEVEKALFQTDQPKFFYQLLQALLQGDAATFKNCNGYELRFATKRADEQVRIS